jgi:hypothetical protein
MNGQCPECGHSAPLISFVVDIEWKQAWMLSIEGLPPELRTGDLLRYLGLFQPELRKLTAKRAVRIITGLISLVATGVVDWDDIGERPAPAWLWASSIRSIVEMDPEKRPKHLENHNYLRRTVWSRAERLAAKNEAQRETARRQGARDEGTLHAHGAPEQVGSILAGACSAIPVVVEYVICSHCRHLGDSGLCYVDYETTKRVRHVGEGMKECGRFAAKE